MLSIVRLLALLALFTGFSASANPLYLINAGGGAYTDSLGQAWSADTGFNTGGTFTTSAGIAGTPDPVLYQSERYDPASGAELFYSLPVSPGTYTVRLHFANIYNGTSQVGQRVFDVNIEGALVLDNYDIVAAAGHLTATVEEFQVSVLDNALAIQFLHVVENPKISAIEVLDLSGGGGPEITTLRLINSDTNLPVAAFDPLLDGAVIDLSALSTNNLNIEALVAGTVDSVKFGLDGDPDFQTENLEPYALASDASGNFNPWTPSLGAHSVTATAYSGPDATGTASPVFAIGFTVTDTPPTSQPPTITSSPSTTATVGTTYNYDVDATDPDVGDTLTFSLETAPAGAGIDTGTGLITWIPTAGQVGANAFTVRVTDLGGLFDEQSFSVDVISTPPAPSVFYRINSGGGPYTDSLGQAWSADTGFNTGGTFTTSAGIAGTPDPVLYQSERYDPASGAELLYSLPVSPGTYTIRLHFANIYNGTSQVGQRVFDVNIEGALVLDNFDIVAAAGHLTAAVEEFQVSVLDNALAIQFLHVVENPKISAIEVLSAGAASLTATPGQLAWGHVNVGEVGDIQLITLDNTGSTDAEISRLDFNLAAGVGHDFHVTLDGNTYTGDHSSVSHTVDVTVLAGTSVQASVQFLPTEEVANSVDLVFNGNFAPISTMLDGIGALGSGDPYLHVVINAPAVVVDYDGNSSESVFLEGSFSHTHEFGRVLASFEWQEDGTPFSSQADTTQVFPVGPHNISLTIEDDNTPPRSLTDGMTIDVVPVDQVPGVVALYYDAQGSNPAGLLNAVPIAADFSEQLPMLLLANASMPAPVMIRFLADVAITASDDYLFEGTGGASSLLLLDGTPVTGVLSLAPGTYSLDARFAVNSLSELPLEVLLTQGAGTPQPIASSALTHDQSAIGPVINNVNITAGSESGGNAIIIQGSGFWLDNEVTVHWGAVDLSGGALTVSPTSIELSSPPGTGQVFVTVETPRGISNGFVFTYSASGPLPINFGLQDVATGISNPTTLAIGPDERLYVGTQSGTIYALTLNDSYQVTGTQVINTIAGFSNPHVLGIGFNPFDPPAPVRLYVSHGQLFANGGSCFTGFSPYSGQISVLEGPNFSAATALVDNLPVSNHDHSVNGMTFDNNGDLYASVGGNTNAGVEDCDIGGVPESPLSGAVIKAELSRPSFNGNVIYLQTSNSQQNMDQVDGDIVDVAPGVDVSVYAPGLRNSYDLVFTTQDSIVATDNGPNIGFGAASTGPNTQDPDPVAPDEILLVEFGRYYGHPNRNRGRNFARENIYHDLSGPSTPGDFTQALIQLPSALGGITEYRANNFNGAMRGDMIVQKWNGNSYRITMSADGRTVVQQQILPVSLTSLDVILGPGGVILGADHGDNKIVVLNPSETSSGIRLFDIFPWRAPATGGYPFVVSGKNFGNLGNTTVLFDGLPAPLSSVSGTRIRGIVPAEAAPTGKLIDVQVFSGGQVQTLQASFRYLLPAGSDPFGWRYGPELDHAIGEVAAGIVGNTLYIVGESHSSTQFYDLVNETWGNPATLKQRQFKGHHHASAVFGGKFYLFGGLGNASEGKVQIFDPATNTWSPGSGMPWSAGSSSASVIGSKIYVCGGIVGFNTVDTCGAYDPVANSWVFVANMPVGRNHAAAASDGSKMYIFGGRGLGSGNGNSVANGFDDIQIYDPVTNTWQWSGDAGSVLAPLPQIRGGTGSAVYFDGEFYVLGGETVDGGGATSDDVYDRVDIYDPVTNSWRVGPPMPTARHGIFPLVHDGQIYVPAGGTSAGGGSPSSVMEIYAP